MPKDAQMFKVVELKAKLQSLNLSTIGLKTELIKRLQEADPSGKWMDDLEEADEDLNPGHVEQGPNTVVNDDVTMLMRELELERRERQIMERELQLMQRENEFLRGASGRQGRTNENTQVSHANVSIKAIGELLNSFDGANTSFLNWEKQVLLLRQTYKLDDNMTKVLIGSRLKGKALDWLHSRPEHLSNTAEELLRDMKKMYECRQNTLYLRRQFERRLWHAEETFHDYYHEKLILANRVPICESEMLDYVIEGIPDIQLRNQARMQQFASETELMAAFGNIVLTRPSQRLPSAIGAKTENRDRKIQATTAKSVSTKNESTVWQEKLRCYNCSQYGHLSRDCKLPKRERGSCFGCGETGHGIKDCPKRQQKAQVNHVYDKVVGEEDFRELIEFEINDGCVQLQLRLDSLIDTGSPVSFIKQSFIPDSFMQRLNITDQYCGINGTKLVTLGTVMTKMRFNGVTKDNLLFYVVPNDTMMSAAVVGRNVLQEFKLTLRAPTTTEENIDSEILNIDVSDKIDDLSDNLKNNSSIPYDSVLELKTLFRDYYLEPERPILPKIQGELKLKVNDIKPFFFSPRRLSYAEKGQLRIILDELIAKGIIRSSESEYASPIVLVKKKNGEPRMCIDYRVLNKYIARDNYPIPIIEDQLNVLRGKKYFSLMDLKDAFYHIRMSEDSIKYTSFTTPHGQFEFLKMPFGLKPAPTKFQRHVSAVLDDLIRSGDLVIYLDDFLVATDTLERHLQILKRIFRLLVENKFELRIDKCKFLFTEIEYLGYMINSDGIRPTKDGINAVLKFPVPQNISQVRSFVGLCSYFRKFIESFSLIAKPLYDLLKKGVIFKFDEVELRAFETLRSKLVTSPILSIYDPHDPTELHCDASALGFGAVLLQRKSDMKLHPVFYFSKRTSASESKFHSFELETLAIIYALKRFRIYLQGIPFKIITDCNSLKLTLQKKEINPRIARWAMELQNYEYTLEHRPGDRMRHVDALSRSPTILVIEDNPLDYNLALCQTQDKNIVRIRQKLEEGEDQLFEMRNGLIYRKRDDSILFYVPENMESHIIYKYHDQMGHLGREKTAQTILKSYWFPNMNKKVDIHIGNCLKCIAYSPNSGKQEGVLHTIPKGNKPFNIIHIDHYGPVDKKHLIKRYIFLVVDSFTKFVKLYATKTTSTRETVNCLMDYFRNFSKPSVIVSDRGSSFVSEEFREFINENGIKHVLIATGSPQANGQVERVNRVLTPMLSKIVEDDTGQYWYKVLQKVEYSINNSVNKSTGETPSRLLFGIDQVGHIDDEIKKYLDEVNDNSDRSIDKARQQASDKIRTSQEYNERYFNLKHKQPHKYKVGDYVMLRNFDSTVGASKKLIPQFKGPYVISKELRKDRYVISDIEGFQNTQKRYQGVWEPKNMRPWLNPNVNNVNE